MLVVNHSVYLDDAERKTLQVIESMVETTGVSVPVWVDGNKTSEPANEVFCYYRIYHSEGNVDVKPEIDGYYICLKTEQCRKLMEKGVESVALSHKGSITIDKITYPVLHQISILSLGDLERSMFCVHLTQTDSK